MIKEIKYNRLHKDVIDYYQTLRMEHFTDNDLYYDDSDPILVIYHTIPMIIINKFFIPMFFDDELLKTVIPKLLKCENYLIQITN